jgi:hypothetical protein
MESVMTKTTHQSEAGNASISDNPDTWGPPAAPLDMPLQCLAPAPAGLKITNQIRHLLAGLRIGIRHEI